MCFCCFCSCCAASASKLCGFDAGWFRQLKDTFSTYAHARLIGMRKFDLDQADVEACGTRAILDNLGSLPAFFSHCGLKGAPPSVPRLIPFRLPLDSAFPFARPINGAPAHKRISRLGGSAVASAVDDSDSDDESHSRAASAHDGSYLMLQAQGDSIVTTSSGALLRRRPVPAGGDSLVRALVRAADIKRDALPRNSIGRTQTLADDLREKRDAGALAAAVASAVDGSARLRALAQHLQRPVAVFRLDTHGDCKRVVLSRLVLMGYAVGRGVWRQVPELFVCRASQYLPPGCSARDSSACDCSSRR